MNKKNVIYGFLGSVLDAPAGADRWERWRPTVALCQQDDFAVHRLELWYAGKHEVIAKRVVDDIRTISPETQVHLHLMDQRDPWNFEEVYGDLLDFAGGRAFDTETEDYYLHMTTGTHVGQICLFLLAEARHFPARLLQASPPGKGDGNKHGRIAIVDLDLSRYDKIAARFAREHDTGTSFLKSGIATRNARFNALIDEIELVAVRSKAPVLLTGPTGAGKSLLARRIHELKKQRRQIEGEFVEVNCATLRGDGAMSALFGHVKGAFTGAAGERAGLLRKADKGILFLDEIGELGLDEQAMLLRALEDKRFLPVGADKETGSDFQLIAGTNRDLAAAVRSGRFREDLLARVNLWTWRLPALRERREDIEPNLAYELDQFARRENRRVAFNKEARAAYLRFALAADSAWPGNFRDLNASVCRMATLAQGGRIGVDHVTAEIDRLRTAWLEPADGGLDSPLPELLPPAEIAALDRFDRVQLEDVLRVCLASPSLSAAGRALFSQSRAEKKSANDADRLRKYLAKFGLDWERIHRETLSETSSSNKG